MRTQPNVNRPSNLPNAPTLANGKAMTNSPIIELKDIRKSFGDNQVLKGISLSARKGDVTALIGSSGSGKSTLLRCANLLETPDDGEIHFQGTRIDPSAARQVQELRANLSMVFQQFNLWAHMSVLENVIEAPTQVKKVPKAEAIAKAMALLDKVGIGDKADSYPSQLSGGQQQRAAIARALAMEPAAMLFDEPTSALDPELEVEVLRVIRQLADEGATMLVVTHDMSFARDVANHVVFVHQGVIEEEGSPAEVFGNTKSERLKQFLSAGQG